MTNALITSIGRVSGATGSGAVTRTAEAVSIRVTASEPMAAQRWALGAIIKDASMVVYIPLDELANVPLRPMDQFTVTVDGLTQQSLEVIHAVTVVKDGGLSHCQVFGKSVG